MRTRAARIGAAWVLTAGLVAGCESSPRRTAYADNPLLQARQPLLQPQGVAAAELSAQAGSRMAVVPPPGLYHAPQTAVAAASPPVPGAPPAPTYPPSVVPVNPMVAAAPPAVAQVPAPAADSFTAALPPTPTPPPAPTPPVAAPAPLPPAPVPTVAAVPTAAPIAPSPVVTQVAARMVEGTYGHAADYTWLQGVLDRHYRGHLELRYRPLSEEDANGGKVRLEDDPRLAEFRPGDVIAVEGELLADPDGSNPSWSQYKRYHVRAVRLVERK
ncbi:MAG TPA: hypothetical protein VGF55_00025 [Gemmataceae bacterium]|jgi:hypothetical protein